LKKKKIFKVICFGTGGSAEKFIKNLEYSNLFSYAIDNNKKKHGKIWKNLKVYPVEYLLKEKIPEEIFIIINSSFQVEICNQLENIGYKLPQHQINGLATTLKLPGEMLKLSRNHTLEDFFYEIKDKVNYCVMRSFADLPEKVPNWDIDMIIDKKGFNILKKNVKCIIPNNKYSGLGIECYLTPSLNKELTYYPDYITIPALKNRKIYKKQLYVPNDYHSLIILAYTCIFLKSEKKTGINFNNESCNVNTKYVKELINYRKKLKIDFSISAQGLYNFLRKMNIAPPLDWARHIAIMRMGQGENIGWLKKLLKNKRRYANRELIIIIIRESALHHKVLNHIIDFYLEQKSLKFNAITLFNNKMKKKAEKAMRSGNWNDVDGKMLSGRPAGLISFVDRDPENLTDRIERKIYPFRGNKLYQLKNKIRDKLNKKIKKKSVINFLHSPDDEREGLEYISLLSDYQLKDHFCDTLSHLDNKHFLKNKFLNN
jgi:hypothetical protein